MPGGVFVCARKGVRPEGVRGEVVVAVNEEVAGMAGAEKTYHNDATQGASGPAHCANTAVVKGLERKSAHQYRVEDAGLCRNPTQYHA